MKNWKTTVGGLLLTAGVALQTQDDPVLKAVGALLNGIGGFIIGLYAIDQDPTD